MASKEREQKSSKVKVLHEASLYDSLPSDYFIKEFIPNPPPFRIVKTISESKKR